jgi:[acyl-carrier-protein] S-malonyltransferase
MGRIGLVFPGQGSQFVGMGGDLCGSHEPFKSVFERAGEILGADILSLCLNGPREALDQTVNTQLAVLTFEIAAFEALKELHALDPAVIAGHSLGEYGAIYASGALGLEEILTLVRSRAKRHEEAVPQGFGAMAAVVGLTLDQMKELVMECSREDEPVDLANINAPIQAVVSGHARAVDRLMERAKEIGAKLVVRLPISAPCHCRLLAEASGLFRKDLEQAHFRPFERPVIPNCDPALFYTQENAAELLRRQIVSPVRWQETIEKMDEMGIETIVEVGPKRVLSGLIRNIRKDMRLVFAGDAESLGRCGELLRAA